MRISALLVHLLAVTAAAQPPALHIPVTVNKPATVRAAKWPITFGVPLAPGRCADAARLRLRTEDGQPAPAQFELAARWPDGSVKWARASFLADLSRRYVVTDADAAQPVTHAFEMARTSDRLDDEYYVIDRHGRRATLKLSPQIMRVEQTGPHTVLRFEGDYLTADGQRLARGRIYLHFFTGFAGVRISHKLILTEDTNTLWLRESGVRLPLRAAGAVTATFNHAHDDPAATTVVELAPGQSATMTQHDFPHLLSTSSRFTVTHGEREITSGDACGDWADVSTSGGGLAVQVPAFSEQFPKAFVVTPKDITVKLWASESGMEMDFRTAEVARNYFGHDWIAADHPALRGPNTARATSRTHDIWVFAHEGKLTDEVIRGLAATREEIFAHVEPDYLTSTGVMDPFLPYDAERYPRVEEVVRDYFLRHVELPERLFPNTGYLGWGRNPYTSQGWQLKDGRWQPTVHRLSRVLEYNLKRCVWVLWARSGERMYYDYARRYTRFLGDWINSNFDTGLKPLGWFVQGEPWESPCFWGAFPQEMIDADAKPPFISTYSTLGYGTSEDVIQYVYDYFFTGDFHSRDSALAYRDAFIREINYDLEKLLTVAPPYVILRPVASALEIDRDTKLYDFMHEYLKIVVGDGSDVVNNAVAQNYVKSGEIWAGFYHYYISTGDELALQPLLRAATRYYRTDRIELIYRGSGMPQAFALTYQHTRDPALLAHLRQAVIDYAHSAVTLGDRGIRLEEVGPTFDRDWGHEGAITTVSPVTIGIPVALRVMADANHLGPKTPRVPLALKPDPTPPTHLFFHKETSGPARIDLYLNNFGDRRVEPGITDAAGRAVAFKIVASETHRVDKPHGDANWQWAYNQFNGTYGTHHFYQFEFDAPPGVYQLRTGDVVRMGVLYSDLEKFEQVCPDGLVLQAERPYFFIVPPGVAEVTLFAHRPIEVFDPAGAKVELEALSEARYRFHTQGTSGNWKILTGSDEHAYRHPYTKVNSFVRFENIPMVIASDDPRKLFGPRKLSPVDTGEIASVIARDLPSAGGEPSFVPGRFGQAVLLGSGQAVEVKLPSADPPLERGTIEFWFRPHWSTTDLYLSNKPTGMRSQQLLHYGPVLVTHDARPVEGGRSPAYLRSVLTVQLLQPEKGAAATYPVTMPLIAGRWYHVAVTWVADGKNSDIEVFLNGKHQTYDDYRGGVPASLSVTDLEPAGQTLRFGSVVTYSGGVMSGQVFDELRLSRSIRYTGDFDPATQPFDADADTFLLLHLDGDLAGGAFAKLSKLR